MSILLKDGLYNQPIDHVLEDLLVRFVINVPDEDLSSIERVFFQVEEAQWFYTDFVRALNQNLPSMKMKTFAPKILNKCPLLWKWGDPRDSLARFGAYKSTIPVRGVAMLNSDLTKVVLLRGYESKTWSFPRGKISKDESDLECAIREVREETGFDCRDHVNETDVLERTICGKNFKIYLAKNVPEDTKFEPLVRNEIAEITWFDIKALQKAVKNNHTKYFVVNILLKPLTRWIDKNKGLVSEKELIQRAEVKLKALMGITSDVNLDAGRELLDILQGAKPQVPANTQDENPQQFIHMSLPRHLQSVYGEMGQIPQSFAPFAQSPAQMHMMPPPEFLPPYYGAPAFRPQPTEQVPNATGTTATGIPGNGIPGNGVQANGVSPNGVQTNGTQATNGSAANGASNSKDFLSILNGSRSKKEEINTPEKIASRPDTPSKKITLLKRGSSNSDASGTLLSLLGKNPKPTEPRDSEPNSNAAELLGILNGKKEKKEEPSSSKPNSKSNKASGELLNILNNPPKDNKASGELLNILNNPPKDNKASGELLSILNNPKRVSGEKTTSAPEGNAPNATHKPADLSAGNQILQHINPGSHTPITEAAPSVANNEDEFADFEEFEDFEEPSTSQQHIYDRIRHTIESESEEEPEHTLPAPTQPTNSAGAGILQLLNGGKPPQSSRASYGDTYGTPEQAPVLVPMPQTHSNNGADLLRLLKRQ